jgi:branched-chain amino acid transport system substrate-binding protein
MKHGPFRFLSLFSLVALLALAACAAPTSAPPAAPPTTAPQATAAVASSALAPPPTTAPAAGGAQPSVYKVGLVNHLTGDGAAYGQSMKKGTDLALDVINGAGGVKGMPIQVIYEDDRMVAADAQTAFLKLVQVDKVPVIMGSGSSSVSLSICPKAQEVKVVLISSISTAPALAQCGKYFFSAMASDVAQGPEWVNVANYLKAKEVAVMYINNDYGIGVKDTFVAAFEKAGGKILIAQPFAAGNKDFRTEVLKVKATNPKVVFIVDHVAEGSIVIKQGKELGMNVQWVTDVSMVATEVPQLAGAAAEGAMGLRAGSTATPEYKAFHDAFVKKYNAEPTIWSDFAYDTMMLVAQAIDKGGYTADGIQQALFQVANTYVGPSGAKKFDEHGISQGVYEWMIVKNGEWTVFQKQ